MMASKTSQKQRAVAGSGEHKVAMIKKGWRKFFSMLCVFGCLHHSIYGGAKCLHPITKYINMYIYVLSMNMPPPPDSPV